MLHERSFCDLHLLAEHFVLRGFVVLAHVWVSYFQRKTIGLRHAKSVKYNYNLIISQNENVSEMCSVYIQSLNLTGLNRSNLQVCQAKRWCVGDGGWEDASSTSGSWTSSWRTTQTSCAVLCLLRAETRCCSCVLKSSCFLLMGELCYENCTENIYLLL